MRVFFNEVLPSLPSPNARTRESRYSGRRPVNQEVICWSIELEAGTNVDILQFEKIMINSSFVKSEYHFASVIKDLCDFETLSLRNDFPLFLKS